MKKDKVPMLDCMSTYLSLRGILPGTQDFPLNEDGSLPLISGGEHNSDQTNDDLIVLSLNKITDAFPNLLPTKD